MIDFGNLGKFKQIERVQPVSTFEWRVRFDDGTEQSFPTMEQVASLQKVEAFLINLSLLQTKSGSEVQQ